MLYWDTLDQLYLIIKYDTLDVNLLSFNDILDEFNTLDTQNICLIHLVGFTDTLDVIEFYWYTLTHNDMHYLYTWFIYLI